MTGFLTYLLRDEIEAKAEAFAEKARSLELKTLRDLIRTRRQGVPQGSLFSIVTYFIDCLEKEESKRDRYATLVWRLVEKHQEEREWIQKEVASFDPMPPR